MYTFNFFIVLESTLSGRGKGTRKEYSVYSFKNDENVQPSSIMFNAGYIDPSVYACFIKCGDSSTNLYRLNKQILIIHEIVQYTSREICHWSRLNT